MIDINKQFVLYARCSVEYDGRAYSTLENGLYLIVSKQDGSMMIHGSDLITPRNYIGSNSTSYIIDNKLIFIRKSEKITIFLDEIISLSYLDNWSNNKITIKRTEKELVDRICDNWSLYFDIPFDIIIREFNTDLGPIDIVGYNDDTFIIIEVKRKRAMTKDVTQLKRYIEAISKSDCTKKIVGYLAAPEINSKANKYLTESGLLYLKVDFGY